MTLWPFLGCLFLAGVLAAAIAERRAGWNACQLYIQGAGGLFVIFPIAWYWCGDYYLAQKITGGIAVLWILSATVATRHSNS